MFTIHGSPNLSVHMPNVVAPHLLFEGHLPAPPSDGLSQWPLRSSASSPLRLIAICRWLGLLPGGGAEHQRGVTTGLELRMHDLVERSRVMLAVLTEGVHVRGAAGPSG